MRTIRSKLSFLIVLAMLLGIVSVTVIASLNLKAMAYQDVQAELDQVSSSQSLLITQWLSGHRAVINAAFKRAADADPVPALQSLADAGGFTQLYVGDAASKDMVYSIPGKKKPTPEYDPASRGWFKQAQSQGSGDVIVTTPYKAASAEIKELVVTLARKISDQKVIGGDIMIGDMTRAVLSTKLAGSGHAFLMTRDGKIIAYPQPGFELKPVSDLAPALDSTRVQALLDDGHAGAVDIQGHGYLLKLTALAGSDWVLGVAADKAEVDAPLSRLVMLVSGAALAILVLVASTTTVYLRHLLGGLLLVRDGMREIAQGEGDLTRRIEVVGNDEVAETAAAFNSFVGSLNTMFQQLRTEAVSLSEGVIDVSRTVDEVAVRSNTLADISSTNAAAIEQVTVSIAHIADAANSTDELARTAGDDTDASAGKMERISAEISHSSSSVAELAGLLGSLEQRSHEISKITLVISDIADQTNLLALNAAIEAARAGEQGRGFAVVADEVRKLAERTGKATVEITAMVESIIGETSRTVSNMQQTVTAVDSGAAMTNEARRHLEKISSGMRQVIDNIGAIALSTREQHNAATSMAQSTESINNEILTTDAMLQHARDTLGQLGSVARAMQDAFARFQL
ncbi:methyl-accepting chemotaxis protein [Paludibacterium yongneupense]|uniref:methyl-accepting chemotaxis protein n=1 Tax=Paludibacterium yongneupense TaxID=400061 RepID=UPI00040011CE|nr:methyl-accepting chemotaxis protein [Paludibacterium yongneupense]